MNRSLLVLITLTRLSERNGVPIVVRDLARGLLRRGHRPVVYSPWLGEVADELSAHGIGVIDDLRNLAETPDVIHAQHVVPAGEALIRFPSTPALFVCHSPNKWAEAPLLFPQVGVFVAVDEACRDRLVHTAAIDPSRVVVVPNAVDLRRVPPRAAPLPERPKTAIAFGKASPLPEIKVACDRLGIAFSAIGYPVGRAAANPEAELVKADLVFASARAALEAMCCGCAVVVCDYRGLAGPVTTRNFDSLRVMNFGARSLNDPISVEGLEQAVGAYDAADANLVGERARSVADFERALDRFEALYFEVMEGDRKPTVGIGAHERAMERFLREYLPRQPTDRRWPWMVEREKLEKRIATLETRLGGSKLPELSKLTSGQQMEIARLEAENVRLSDENAGLKDDKVGLRNEARKICDELVAEKILTAESHEKAISEKQAQIDRLESENKDLRGRITLVEEKIGKVKNRLDARKASNSASAIRRLLGPLRNRNSRS